MTDGCELSVVVPIFNERENVEPLHAELTSALAGMAGRYELILVDDGSRDGTTEALRSLAAGDVDVQVLRLRRNYGQSAALQAGLDHAMGAVIVTMDGDLQNDPADIPRLLSRIHDGFDVVCGWRRARQDRFLSRRLPSVVANWLIGRLTGVRIHDNGCTLRAYRGEVVKRASLYAEMHRFMAPLLSLSGGRCTEVVVNHRPRRYGRSKYGLSRIWKVFLDLLAVKMILRFALHPAIWFALLGFPFLLAAALAGAESLYLYATLEEDWESPIVLPSVTVLCAFAALHFLLVGMFAELVVTMGDYRETEPIVAVVELRDA